MHYHVLTLFPEMIEQGMGTSIMGRAMEQGLIRLTATNIRDFSTNKHMKVDDYPYGGGAGMVMQAEPVYGAWKQVTESIGYKPRVIYLTPQGKVFQQSMVEDFAREQDLVFLCGHYEGIDERVLEEVVTDYVSIVPGVLNNEESAEFDSFHDNLLEYPQYSRPAEWMGKKVPDVLLSGHHANIEKWRREQSILRTLQNRPELLEDAVLSKKEKQYLEQLRRNMAQEDPSTCEK